METSPNWMSVRETGYLNSERISLPILFEMADDAYHKKQVKININIKEKETGCSLGGTSKFLETASKSK
jgi:hypothetical protein